VHARPPRRITHVAEILDEEDVIVSLLLEVASTPEERKQGLMNRKELPTICGMLFKGLSGGGTFWMKNCLIPLDIMFLNKDGFITKIYTMPADDGKKRYQYDDKDVYAIEVNSDFCKKHGIVAGCKVLVSKIEKESSNG
jgi:uncharacterized membrane protein (UPF0127 family)